ncbi:hypothetical protein L6452_37691 [Arctium lappa]|uniref:Uncharacterized protein n=1 Tax=Arctium lappa TaxID=4217 RepID=A0ACB8Y310_ARCLA|nr:hypothetical protein L6452_37691 [Arctium lappa]
MAIRLWLLIHLLLIILSTISVSGNVFVSIDCGASGSYTDENSIVWTGDGDLISNGVSHTVQSNYSISRVYDTLRAFTTRKKNCYSIEAEEGGKVLVRVVFNYGNYDGKSTPPMFDLHFDGNFWITVNTSQSIYYEAIYVVKRKVISVCVAQTNPNQFPFISSLEVRSVDPRAYSHIGPDYALFMTYRIGYGLNETIRFPSDPYDRAWDPTNIGEGLLRVVNDASFINANTPNNPPQAVLKSSMTTPNTSRFITLGLGTIAYPIHYPMYINFYFIEVKRLNSTETRSFRIYIDTLPFSLPIVPRFGNATEYFISNLSVTADTQFHIVATAGSTLPPLLSAIEIFSISDALTNGTNNNDVEGLLSLQNAFDVLQKWDGDPCLPAPYSWDWIKCNDDPMPRVTSLNLNSFNLSGRLPNFSNMDALEIIDLHNNNLSGPVPDFLGTMLNLKQLNLADNQFSGSIPRSLSRNSQLNISDTGNPLLCTNNTSCPRSNSNKKRTNKFPVILAITIPVFFIL